MQRIIRTIGAMFILGSLLALTPGAWAQDGHGQEQQTDTKPHDTHAAAQDEHGEANSHEDAGHDQEGHGGTHAAEALAVGEPPSWYSKVITGAVVLFVLAATLGSVAVLTKAPEPQEPDHHDDHGHDHGGHGHH